MHIPIFPHLPIIVMIAVILHLLLRKRLGDKVSAIPYWIIILFISVIVYVLLVLAAFLVIYREHK